MNNIIIKTLSIVALIFGFAMTYAVAEYPDKPVEFVVPAAVANKPGGGGGPFPGAISVARASADGYTVGSFVVGVPVVGPGLGIPELNPDPFVPVGIFLTYPFLIVAAKDAPYNTMEELAVYAKKMMLL